MNIAPIHSSNAAPRPVPLKFTTGFLEEARKFSFKITSQFEGGKNASLQLKDAGIISYGKHQATLASGALYKVLDRYTTISDRPEAVSLCAYLEKVRAADPALRKDNKFLNLLLEAAHDPLMGSAQDQVFSEYYWKRAIRAAEETGIKSKAGLAILYDTDVQGGLSAVMNKTLRQTENRPVAEREFLNLFLENRRRYLNDIAATKRLKGDFTTARMLENAARSRIAKLQTLLQEK